MRITVKLFALLREQAGVAEMALDLPTDATVSDAAAALAERLPAIRPHAPHVAYAVNRSYAQPTVPLHDGDELAVLPPVSGG